jgi:hypothetical protein
VNSQTLVVAPIKSSKDLRNKIVAVRLSESEMLSVIAAAEASGGSQADWLRERVLSHDQPHTGRLESPSMMVLLEEIMALRALLINLFPSAIPNYPVAAVRTIMAHAQTVKRKDATDILRLFLERIEEDAERKQVD